MSSGSTAISVVIPAYNEETVIGGLLENLAALAPDEVVVADGSSTDRTVEIAEKLGAKVIDSPWPGYAKQKNLAAEPLMKQMHDDLLSRLQGWMRRTNDPALKWRQ